MSYLRSSHINLALGPSEHIVPFVVSTICPRVVRAFFGAAMVFYLIILLNIKGAAVGKRGIYLHGWLVFSEVRNAL